jgi:hypothetical protein
MPFKNAVEQLKLYKSNLFIETGTNSGGTSIVASAIFENIITIEIDESKYKECIKKFEPYKNIQSFLGDSTAILPAILNNIEDKIKITFWLDAHISFNSNSGLCPLYQELEIINNLSSKEHTILIDDVRCLKSNKYGWEKMVDLDSVIKKILEINPKYNISYLDGYIEKDILVAKV